MNKPAFIAIAAGLTIGLSVVAALSVPTSFAMSGKPSADLKNSDRHSCFDPDEIRNFQAESDDKLILVSDFHQVYELKLTGACIGLDTSLMIGIRSRGGMHQVCGPFDADVIYRDHIGDRPQECRVTDVRHLTDEEAAKYIDLPKKKAG